MGNTSYSAAHSEPECPYLLDDEAPHIRSDSRASREIATDNIFTFTVSAYRYHVATDDGRTYPQERMVPRLIANDKHPLFSADDLARMANHDVLLLSMVITDCTNSAPLESGLVYTPAIVVRHENVNFDSEDGCLDTPADIRPSGGVQHGETMAYACPLDLSLCRLIADKRAVVDQLRPAAPLPPTRAPAATARPVVRPPRGAHAAARPPAASGQAGKSYFPHHGGLMFRRDSFLHNVVDRMRPQLATMERPDGRPLDTNVYLCEGNDEYRCIDVDTAATLRDLMCNDWFGRISHLRPADCSAGLAAAPGNARPPPPPSSEGEPEYERSVVEFHVSYRVKCRLLLMPRQAPGGSHHDVVPYLTFDTLRFDSLRPDIATAAARGSSSSGSSSSRSGGRRPE